MDAISNVDRLVLILRQKLAERAKVAAPKQQPSAASRQNTGLHGVQALAAVDSVDDRQFKRAVIQSILSEQLGGDLINEAKFQQVVSRVTDALDEDATASKLLSRVASELRKSAR